MSDPQPLDDGMRYWIVGRFERDQYQVQICREFNLMPSVMCNLWKQFQDTGSIERKPEQGHSRATTVREDHYFSIIASRNRRLKPLSSIVTYLQSQEPIYQR
ncbi:uncharacterized protein TNCV_4678291 [Trichonephila clavipes]|nr:uncharacterized protein TNCV_4678291 [Trichonephila clavipes]